MDTTDQGLQRKAIPLGSYIMFLTFFIAPFVGVLTAIYYWWGHGVDTFYLVLFAVMYVLTALGTTGGYHRLFTHESFTPTPFAKLMFGIFGSMAIQGKIYTWCTLHDVHHKNSDKQNDPHSPVMLGDGFWTLCKGFWHAQIGWMFIQQPLPHESKCAIRLSNDPIVRFVDRYILLWISLGGLVPAYLGYIHEGNLLGAWYGFLWGGLVRVFFHQHFTSAVNSICHIWGKRKFRTGDRSTDNWFVAIFTFGEGFHNGHHAFMRSSCHGLDTPWYDMTYQFLKLLELLGFVRDVDKTIPDSERLSSLRIDEHV